MLRTTPAKLEQTLFDLVVIGGGITGVATARDAALRGLSVLLVEKDDFAAGTSSRSSKLIHGGLRYLQTYQFGLVAESLRERERMLQLAPHLTEVHPFLYLLYRGYPETKSLLNLGLTFYDVASGQWRKRRHTMMSAKRVSELEPHLRTEGLVGAGRYYDVLTDDARLTVDTAKGAAAAGAILLNHAAVVELVLEGGRARGVVVADQLTGTRHQIHARQVLNATGPWTDRTRSLEQVGEATRLRPTKGVHIVLRKSDFPLNTAVFLRSPDDNRVVWPTPSLESDVVYVGTTDTDYTGDLDRVEPTEDDVRYLLNVANHTIPSARLTEQHIVGSWAGLRPLVAPEPGTSTGNTPREHVITTGSTGMLTISGGKLTSNRIMAKHLVDAAVKALGISTRAYSASTTPLSGGGRFDEGAVRRAAQAADVPDDVSGVWIRRYGSNAEKVLDLWLEAESARVVIGPRHLSVAEIRHAVREEMSGSLEDLLVRRTSIFFWDADGGLQNIEAIAGVLAQELDWSATRLRSEIEGYARLVRAHRPGGFAPD